MQSSICFFLYTNAIVYILKIKLNKVVYIYQLI